MPSLKLALIHSAVDHKQPETNRENLLSLFREAGEKGAQLVVGPELSISGYAFNSHRDMAPYAETADGPTLTALAGLCRTYGMYAGIGLAEQDARTGILYNSAFVLGPAGDVVCRYRKINAECRWACPGDPREDNTFASPWGRIGVLICSDSYHSLMPRVTALRGADLLVVLANWPPTGLDPLEIWRARALENGIHVAACNRTGQDLSMDCRQAPSAVFSAHGTTLLNKHARTSKLMRANLPLNDAGQLKSDQRLKRTASRRFDDIHACYRNLAESADLTSLLQLPPPGALQICCHCADALDTLTSAAGEVLQAAAGEPKASSDVLHILAAKQYSDSDLVEIQHYCAAAGQKATLCRLTDSGSASVLYWFDGENPPQSMPWNILHGMDAGSFPCFDCGPARVHIFPFKGLYHPETALASAKQGCDLAVVFSHSFTDVVRLLGGARTIDNVAVAVCSPEGAGVWTTPAGHQRWEEVVAGPGESCRFLLDTNRTRKKRFQDRIDFDTLLQGAVG